MEKTKENQPEAQKKALLEVFDILSEMVEIVEDGYWKDEKAQRKALADISYLLKKAQGATYDVITVSDIAERRSAE